MIYPLGATSQSIDVLIVDNSGLPVTGLVAATFPPVTYSRAGANADAAISLSNLALITTAWAAGGLKERGEGVYRLDLPDAAFAVVGHVRLRGEASGKRLIAATLDVGILSDTVPGSYASGTAGHALGQIGSAQITITSPVDTSGNITVRQGFDYFAADGLAIDITDSADAWPTLSGATVTAQIRDGALAITASIITATGSGKKVRLEPTAAQTASLPPGEYRYVLSATLSGGHVVPLASGNWTVLDAEAN